MSGSRQGHFRSVQPRACCLCSLPVTQQGVAGDALPSFCNRGQRHFSVKLHSIFPATLICPFVAVIQVCQTGSSGCAKARPANAPCRNLEFIGGVQQAPHTNREAVSKHSWRHKPGNTNGALALIHNSVDWFSSVPSLAGACNCQLGHLSE